MRRCLVFFLLVLAAAWPAQAADGRKLILATGEVHGFFYPVGGAVCRALSRSTGAQACLVAPTGGSAENLALLKNGEADLAIVQSRLLFQAAQGQGGFEKDGPFEGLRSVLALHDESVLLLARKQSGIRTLADLKGKRVATGQSGGFVRQMTDLLFTAASLRPGDLGAALEIEPARLAASLCADEIDAAFFAGIHPMREAAQAMAECGAQPVGIPEAVLARLIEANPFLYRIRLEPGLYEGAKSAVPTFATRAILTATDRLGDSEAYLLAKSVADNFEALGRYHPALKRLTRNDMARPGAGIAAHPGAERFFRE